MKIYDNKGTEFIDVEINEGSKRKFELMKEDYINLKFSLDECKPIKVGCYVDFRSEYDVVDGKRVDRYPLLSGLWRFEASSDYLPTYNKETGGYDYDVQFDNYYIKWKNKIFKYMPMGGGQESSWSLTEKPSKFLAIIKSNIDARGYTLGETNMPFQTVIDESFDNQAITLTFSSTSILDALTMIAQAVNGGIGCDWWVKDNIVYFGLCENVQGGEVLNLTLGDNVESISSAEGQNSKATRIYAYGSDRNITKRYRKELRFTPTKHPDDSTLFRDATRPVTPDMFNDTTEKTVYTDVANNLDIAKETKAASKNFSFATSFFDLGATDEAEPFKVTVKKYAEQEDIFVIKVPYTGSYEGFEGATATVSFYKGDTLIKNIEISCKETTSTSIDGSYVIRFPYSFTEQEIEMPKGSIRYRISGSMTLPVTPLGSAQLIVGALKMQKKETVYVKDIDVDCYNMQNEKLGSVTCKFNALERPNNSKNCGWIRGTLKSGTAYYKIPSIIGAKTKDAWYTKSVTENDSVNAVVVTRLMLPENPCFVSQAKYDDVQSGNSVYSASDIKSTGDIKVYSGHGYVDSDLDLHVDEIIEEVDTIEDVYPSKTLKVTKVSDPTIEDIEDSEDKIYRYKIFAELRNFSDSYKIDESKSFSITFRSGKLNGMTFDVDVVKKETTADTVCFEIQPAEYTVSFPNDVFKPVIDDEFNLFNYDSSYIDDELVYEAERELLAQTLNLIIERKRDDRTYTADLMSDWVYNNGNPITIDLGRRVALKTSESSTLIESRVIGVEYFLDYPYDTPSLTIGKTSAYSRFRDLQQQIDNINFRGTAYSGEYSSSSNGGGSSVILIGRDSTIQPADTNTYSALRIDKEIENAATDLTKELDGKYIHKDKDDETEHSLTAKNVTAKAQKDGDGNVVSGTGVSRAYEGQIENILKFIGGTAYTEGLQGARFFLDGDGNWHLDIDYLNIHRKLQASDVEISHSEHIGGKLLNTAARCTIKHVVDIKPDNENLGSFICFFEKSDSEGNTIYNTWQKEDLAYCETFNLTSGGGKVGNHFYWRKVVFTDTSTDFYVKDSYVDTDGNAFSTDGLLFIVLGKTSALKAEYSDAPRAGDYVCQLGNTNPRSGRDGAIILASTDTSMTGSDGGSARVPYIRIYKGINTFTLPKARIDLNPYNPSLNVSQLTITTVGEEGDSTYTLEEYINGMLPLDKFDIYQIKEAWVPSTQSYAFDYTWESGGVTYTSEPYATWYENDEVDKHNQEPNNTVFLNGEGRTWRFVKDGEYDKWEEFSDPYLIEALRIAKEAKQAADNAGLSEDQKAQLVKEVADRAKSDINEVLLDEEHLPNDAGVVCKAAILTKGKNAFIGTYKAAKEGNQAQMLSQSGLLTTDNYAEVFAEGLKKDGSPLKATMKAYVTDEMSHVDIEADKVKITSGDKKLGDYFSLENGNVEMQNLKAKNITVEGVINNLIMDVDGNETDKPLLIQNGEDGVDLDVLRCGSIIHLKNVAETHIRLPYYIYRDRGGTDHGRNQVQRTLTYYNTNEKHLMTTSELFQLVGKTITIIVDDTCTSQSFKINGKPYKQYIADGTGTDGRIDKLREQFSDLVNSAFNDEYVIDDFDSEQGISVSSSFIYQFTFKQGYTYMYRNGQIAGTCLAFYWQLRRAIIYGVNDDDNFWD